MTKEGIYQFISRQKTSLISSVDAEGYPATRALIQPVLIDGNDITLPLILLPGKSLTTTATRKRVFISMKKGAIFKALSSKGRWPF